MHLTSILLTPPGVSGGAHNVDRQQPLGRRRIWHWRNVMEYILMAFHTTCIDILDPSGEVEGKYDTVGEVLKALLCIS